MAGSDNWQQESAQRTETVAGRLPGQGEDLRSFLQQLSDQFADADRRHSESLRDMRERLARLGGQAEALKESMPKGFEADLERLEAGMLVLAKQMAEAEQSRARPGSATGSQPAQIAVATPVSPVRELSSSGDEAAPRAEMRPALMTPPPALKSAVPAGSQHTWTRADQTGTASELASRSDDEPWDQSTADALASVYETGAADGPKLQHPLDLETAPATAKPTGVTSVADSTRPASTGPATGPRSEADRQWLESQLSDIASRIERSLAEFKPQGSMDDLSRRFDALEDRWNAAVDGIASRTDVEGLKIVEAHVTELTQKLEQAQAQLSRLDAIEAQIADLAAQLSDDQIVRLFSGLVPTEEDLTRFAETAAQKVAAGMHPDTPAGQAKVDFTRLAEEAAEKAASRMIASASSERGQVDYARIAEEAAEKVAARMIAELPAAQSMSALQPASLSIPPSIEANQIESNERISQLQQTLTSLIDERRVSALETNEALETMQQAMQHVLDRFESIEAATTGAHPPALAPTPSKQAQLADVAAHFEQSLPGPIQPRAMPEPAPVSSDTFEDAKAAARAAAAAAGRGAAPTGNGPNSRLRAQMTGASRMSDPSLDASAAELAGDTASGQGQARSSRGAAPAGGRNSVLENARRAAERARVAQAGEDDDASKGRGLLDKVRSQKNAKSAGDAKAPGVKSSVLVVASIALLLLAGFWLLKGTKLLNFGSSVRTEQTSPAAVKAKTKASPAVVEEEGDSPEASEKGAAKRNKPEEETERKAPAPEKRSETPTLRQAAVEGSTVAGMVTGGAPGIAVQHSAASQLDIARTRQQMQIAALSQQTAQNAVEAASASPTAKLVQASAVQGDVPPQTAQSATVAPAAHADGKTVLELPPALVGPLSLRLAAAKGDPSAQFEVAARFAEGKGIKQDFGQAAAWYQRAANQGVAPAQYRLAALFERGLGVKADPARARVWYKRAAEQGNIKAMHNLAVLSAGRDQGAPDYPTAAQWFTEAAERGLADSQYNLGVLLESGLGVAKDPIAAYKWYALAARSGDREALRRHEALKGKLDPLNLQTAENAVASWRPRAVDTAANDAITAGSAWKARAATAATND